MKRRFWRGVIAPIAFFLILTVGLYGMALAQEPTLEERIETAELAGLAWLALQQNADGSWGGGGDRVAWTGLVLLKLESRAIELRMDPLGPDYEYATEVQNGLDFILTHAHELDISLEPLADTYNSNLKGMLFNEFLGSHDIYNTALAIMAIAASGHPELYSFEVQEGVDAIAFAQADPDCGLHRGGWRYACDECNSDNSNTGYVTLALGYAAAEAPHGFGLEIPDFVKDELNLWIDVIQDDVNGDADDGGSWYDPYWAWVNTLKTGNLLYEMALVGDTLETQRVQDAIDYVERHWEATGAGDIGWHDHCQAMFTMMKGFEAFGIETIEAAGEADHAWFEEVAEHLLAKQNADGSWPNDPWGGPVLSTAWAMLTLERAVPLVAEIPLACDIKPGSCPNPFNMNAKGVLPVAMLGTEEFDVSQIDPATVMLYETVPPLRWSYEYAAAPFEPMLGKEEAYECTTETDGYMDMTMKFDRQAVAAALGDCEDGDVMVLSVRGNLKEEFGGMPFHGEDVVIIIKKK